MLFGSAPFFFLDSYNLEEKTKMLSSSVAIFLNACITLFIRWLNGFTVNYITTRMKTTSVVVESKKDFETIKFYSNICHNFGSVSVTIKKLNKSSQMFVLSSFTIYT